MLNILANFEWSKLFDTYGGLCRSFPSKSKKPTAQRCLSAFSPTPASDVELYRRLVSRFALEKNSSAGISVESYAAVLWWKMYTTQPEFCKRLFDAQHSSQAKAGLKLLKGILPQELPKQADNVIEAVHLLDDCGIYGMKDNCRYAVRTTFLHFLFPETVPIMDVMALGALGKTGKGAGMDQANLKPYFERVWELETQNSSAIASNFKGGTETPVRLIEMALFVRRNRKA